MPCLGSITSHVNNKIPVTSEKCLWTPVYASGTQRSTLAQNKSLPWSWKGLFACIINVLASELTQHQTLPFHQHSLGHEARTNAHQMELIGLPILIWTKWENNIPWQEGRGSAERHCWHNCHKDTDSTGSWSSESQVLNVGSTGDSFFRWGGKPLGREKFC